MARKDKTLEEELTELLEEQDPDDLDKIFEELEKMSEQKTRLQ